MIKKYIKGDIVKIFLEGHNVAHGCNCFHTMGAGVAGQLAKAYPPILEIDVYETEHADPDKLGNYTQATGGRGQICFNLYTQYEPGPNINYGALLYAFQGLNRWASKCLENPTVYIPRIGAGIAGGDWNKIKLIIDMFTPDIDIIVVDWDGE
ncbi:hypothetical protein EBPHNEJP_00181 [Salmonella phage CF-SP2]|nr:hypothetical protein EBPHNEJP_00181 [Salmonella phage CF-SP2]